MRRATCPANPIPLYSQISSSIFFIHPESHILPSTFKEVVFLDCGADKDEVLAQYGSRYPGHIWIEDKKQNVDVGIACGLKGLLMEHAHNMDYTGPAKIVKTWEEIYKYYIKLNCRG